MKSFPCMDLNHVSLQYLDLTPRDLPSLQPWPEIRGLAGLAFRCMGKCSQGDAWVILIYKTGLEIFICLWRSEQQLFNSSLLRFSTFPSLRRG